jgi:DNA-binding NarL/FixJ family response regulator
MPGPLKRVLIADDHAVMRRGIRQLVETRPNFAVVAEAASGHEAIEEARRTMPDIAIVDYSMPELDGLELTIELKRDFPKLEIVIFTMYESEDIITDLLTAGARGFVVKSDPDYHLLGALDALAMHRPYFSGAVPQALLDHFLNNHPRESVLTRRERDVVQQLTQGKTNRQVASRLGITIKTVETHRASAMRKLNLKTTADLVRYAIRNDLTPV